MTSHTRFSTSDSAPRSKSSSSSERAFALPPWAVVALADSLNDAPRDPETPSVRVAPPSGAV